LLVAVILAIYSPTTIHANPHSKPYIPFRTDPYDQPSAKGDDADFVSESSDDHKAKVFMRRRPTMVDPEKFKDTGKCPLRFTLGVSKQGHKDESPMSPMGIQQPPLVYPILPWEGPGRQVVFATQYEHLDLLTPSRRSGSLSGLTEGLEEHLEFPLLFESSAFQTSPIIADVNDDGILDAILTDYHGGLYAIGLQVGNPNENHQTNHRYFLKAQVPRLYVRRQWVEAMVNETLGIDPYEAEKKAEEEEKKRKEEEEAKKKAEGGESDPKDEFMDQHRHSAYEERPHDPYHSYFEYSYGHGSSDHETILRGVTANLLGQNQEHVQGLDERRNRNHHAEKKEEEEHIDMDQKNEQIIYDSAAEDEKNQKIIYDSAEEEEKNQKIIYDSAEESVHRRLLDMEVAGEEVLDDLPEWQDFEDDLERSAIDDYFADVDMNEGSDSKADGQTNEGEEGVYVEGVSNDDIYPHYDDDMARMDDYSLYNAYDDYYKGKYGDLHDEYFDDEYYMRLPPHVLCTPVLAELPKPYTTNGETENLLFVAVSYYYDEDEYEGFFSYKRFENSDHGDETETKRGLYTANAIMVFHFGQSPRWGRQEHLDLSADHSAPVNMTVVGSVPMLEDNSKLGAFALASPTIADIDGDGKAEVLMGTSMGFLYVMDTQNLIVRDGWPIQLQHAIESRVVVEDVIGDTNLEIFVADVGGNIFCLDHTGKKIWHRNLPYSLTGDKNDHVLGSSPMVLGDVNGDGVLDIVIMLQIKTIQHGISSFLFAISADTGKDLEDEAFPINIWTKSIHIEQEYNVGEDYIHAKLPPPLLVDMHEDQDFVLEYLRRNGTKWTKPQPKASEEIPHGGSARGLHVVQPIDTYLVIVEAGSGCTQSIEIGEKINSMVQADDVHGTNKLDLVISTANGNVVTLESEAPFHPLNVWNNGELQSRTSSAVHGYSASQGIFVHEVSRQYRDIFGVYIPVTFEIFDNRPNIQNEPDKRKYAVDVKTGTSKVVLRKTFDSPGIYTERMYIPSGPGYYEMSVILKTSHGLTYEDAFHLGYNVNYMDGFSILLWLPLTIATICVFLMGANKAPSWEDDDFSSSNGKEGILGGGLPE